MYKIIDNKKRTNYSALVILSAIVLAAFIYVLFIEIIPNFVNNQTEKELTAQEQEAQRIQELIESATAPDNGGVISPAEQKRLEALRESATASAKSVSDEEKQRIGNLVKAATAPQGQ